MLKWFLAVDDICAEMEKEARDAIEYFEDHDALETEPSEDKVEGFKKTLTAHLKRLKADWPDDIGPNRINDLTRHIGFSERHDFSDMVHLDIPCIRGAARDYAGKTDAAP